MNIPSYWPISNEFLNTSTDQCFDLYIKDKNTNPELFIKFAGRSPSHQKKVRGMLEDNSLKETLYVHKNEMENYFEQATKKLTAWKNNDQISPEEKAKKVYGLSHDIMKGFFEFHASENILTSMESVMETMEECILKSDQGCQVITETLIKDFSLYTHCTNVGLYCLSFGTHIKLDPEEIKVLGLGGVLFDIGMSKVPKNILNKQGPLTPEETNEVKKHTQYGKEILDKIGIKDEKVVQILENHHEEFGGGGYPRGLSGEKIPYLARIVKIMDVYDALTSPRPHRKGMVPIEAFTLMTQEFRSSFDVEILKEFIVLMGPVMN